MADALVPRTPAGGIRRVREQISWVEDEDLSRLEEKGEMSAASLSFISGGGGQLYVGEYAKGFALTAAQLAALTLGFAAGAAVGWLPFLALGTASAVNAWRKARAINRYLAAKREEYDRQNPHPAAYRLLAAMSAADPSAIRESIDYQRAAGNLPAPQPGQAPAPPNPLIERLRKLAALREAGAVNDGEFRARKVELLEKSFSGIERDQLDDRLYELLPLMEEGVLDREDVEFIKALEGI